MSMERYGSTMQTNTTDSKNSTHSLCFKGETGNKDSIVVSTEDGSKLRAPLLAATGDAARNPALLGVTFPTVLLLE